MDDLKTLRELRADAPLPDAGRLSATRARFMSEGPEAGRFSAARAAAGPRGRGLRAFPRPLLLAAAFAAVAALVAVFAHPGQTGGAPPSAAGRYAGTAVTLERAALVAGSRSTSPTPRPDQWQYSRSMDKQANGPDAGRVQEEWIRYDGKRAAVFGDDGRLRISKVPPDPGDDDLSPQRYAERLRKLPTDPAKLLARVSADLHWINLPVETAGGTAGAEDADARAFRVLSVYLGQQAVMPPKLEAAIYRALARIPGVRIELDVQDGSGRKGLGVFRDTGPVTRRYVILEPGTFRYLGTRMVWLRGEEINGEIAFRAGSVWTVTELASGIVDRAGDRP
ncbi:CU044_5270 family protein [Sphaerisporangium corydalis]|uniref:CU044_5270 family protein n=1 Tax=Sphaerisporangium corydalis TaxID=1441875 RepID=A0ABV9E9S4_9ACTN|nr:CU044_5270 family protein [Sphaerisporangium corydalis]